MGYGSSLVFFFSESQVPVLSRWRWLVVYRQVRVHIVERFLMQLRCNPAKTLHCMFGTYEYKSSMCIRNNF